MNKKINNKIIILRIIILMFVVINISFVSGCIDDKYDSSGSVTESYDYFFPWGTWAYSLFYSVTESMTGFKHDSVTGWSGSGTITEEGGYSYGGSFPESGSWNILIEVNCHGITCTVTCLYSDSDGKTHGCIGGDWLEAEERPDPMVSSPLSPYDGYGYTGQYSRLCGDFGETPNEPNEDCTVSCEHPYGPTISSCIFSSSFSDTDSGYDGTGEYRTCSFEFSHTYGENTYCCDKNGDCNMDDKDWVCDLKADIPGKDSCNNIDTDGKKYDYFGTGNPTYLTKDECCPAELGDKEKYIVPAGEKVLVINTDLFENQACSILNSTFCYDSYDCKWDPFKGCIAKPIEICNYTGADKCVECAGDSNCGTGRQCCNGECIDPVSRVCCGPTGLGVDCREKESRIEWCVESGDVCYKAGANAWCKEKSQELPLGWVKDVSDDYYYIAGSLATDITTGGNSVCRGLSAEGTINIGSESISEISPPCPLNCRFIQMGPNVKGSILTSIFDINVMWHAMSTIETRIKHYPKIVGYKKTVVNEGRGRGGARGDGTPSDIAITELFGDKDYELHYWFGGGPVWKVRDWTVNPYALIDLATREILPGIQLWYGEIVFIDISPKMTWLGISWGF